MEFHLIEQKSVCTFCGTCDKCSFKVSPELKIEKIEIFYKPDEFLEVLQGDRAPEDLHGGTAVIGQGGGCPFIERMQK